VFLFSSNDVVMWLIILLRIWWVSGLISCKVMGFPHVYCYGCPQWFQANSEIGRSRCLPHPFEFIFHKPSCYLTGVVEKAFLNDWRSGPDIHFYNSLLIFHCKIVEYDESRHWLQSVQGSVRLGLIYIPEYSSLYWTGKYELCMICDTGMSWKCSLK